MVVPVVDPIAGDGEESQFQHHATAPLLAERYELAAESAWAGAS